MKNTILLMFCAAAIPQLHAATMASQPWTTNRIAEAEARLGAQIGGKADKTNTYTRAEADARIIELAPMPGDYATVSNRAMSALQNHQSLQPSTNYTDHAIAEFANTGTVFRSAAITDGTNTIDAAGGVYKKEATDDWTYERSRAGAGYLSWHEYYAGMGWYIIDYTGAEVFLSHDWNLESATFSCIGGADDEGYYDIQVIATRVMRDVFVGNLALTNDIPTVDYTTANTQLVATIEATAPAPGDYETVSNRAMTAIQSLTDYPTKVQIEDGWWSEWKCVPAELDGMRVIVEEATEPDVGWWPSWNGGGGAPKGDKSSASLVWQPDEWYGGAVRGVPLVATRYRFAGPAQDLSQATNYTDNVTKALREKLDLDVYGYAPWRIVSPEYMLVPHVGIFGCTNLWSATVDGTAVDVFCVDDASEVATWHVSISGPGSRGSAVINGRKDALHLEDGEFSLSRTAVISQVDDRLATTNGVENAIREKSLGGIWDQQLEVWWTPVMVNGALTYQATTNVNLNAEGNQ